MSSKAANLGTQSHGDKGRKNGSRTDLLMRRLRTRLRSTVIYWNGRLGNERKRYKKEERNCTRIGQRGAADKTCKRESAGKEGIGDTRSTWRWEGRKKKMYKLIWSRAPCDENPICHAEARTLAGCWMLKEAAGAAGESLTRHRYAKNSRSACVSLSVEGVTGLKTPTTPFTLARWQFGGPERQR